MGLGLGYCLDGGFEDGSGLQRCKIDPQCALCLLGQNMGYPSGVDYHLVGTGVALFIPVHPYAFTPDGDLGMMVTHCIFSWCSRSTATVN